MVGQRCGVAAVFICLILELVYCSVHASSVDVSYDTESSEPVVRPPHDNVDLVDDERPEVVKPRSRSDDSDEEETFHGVSSSEPTGHFLSLEAIRTGSDDLHDLIGQLSALTARVNSEIQEAETIVDEELQGDTSVPVLPVVLPWFKEVKAKKLQKTVNYGVSGSGINWQAPKFHFLEPTSAQLLDNGYPQEQASVRDPDIYGESDLAVGTRSPERVLVYRGRQSFGLQDLHSVPRQSTMDPFALLVLLTVVPAFGCAMAFAYNELRKDKLLLPVTDHRRGSKLGDTYQRWVTSAGEAGRAAMTPTEAMNAFLERRKTNTDMCLPVFHRATSSGGYGYRYRNTINRQRKHSDPGNSDGCYVALSLRSDDCC